MSIYQTGLNFITANEWQHVAVTRTSGVLNLYRNGIEYNGSRPTQNGTINTGLPGRIGKWYNTAHAFKGQMSNVQTFNTALPAAGSDSIVTLYNSGKPLPDMSGFTSLQGWWKLNDTATFNSGTSVWSIPDASTNSNTGTSSGMDASNLVASSIDGELISNPMALSPKPISYYQLGDQSVSTGPTSDYLVPNNSLQDYVFNFISPNFINFGNVNNFERTDSFSFSVWVNIASYVTYYYISKQLSSTPFTGYNLFSTSNGKLQFLFNNNFFTNILRVTSTSQIPLNQWVHLTLTYDGSSLASGVNMYFNGVPETIITLSNVLTASTLNTTDCQISGRDGGSGNLIGDVSNVSIFNTELSSPQVEAIYNNGSPNDISSLNPVSWYKLNAADTFNSSTSTWTIKDYGSSGNDGTSSGMTSSNLVQSDLQQTSGYSPYALDFGGITASLKTYTIPAATNTVTLSAWVKRTGASGSLAGVFGVRNSGAAPGYGICWDLCFLSTTNKIEFRVSETDGSAYIQSTSNVALTDNTWTHVVGVADGTNVKLYINGVLQTDVESYNGTLRAPTSNILFAAQGPTGGGQPFNGQLSNCARWNIGLTQAEVTEIYNQGVPSNLNNFSGTAPIGWWQLGSNSSFEGNDWTCLDEIGTDYADSHSTAMTNDDIVNGPGYSGSGLGSSSIDIKGDAPYSTANGLSENMDVLDRTIDVPG